MKTPALQLFLYDGDENRVFVVDGEPWFVAADFVPYFTTKSTTDCLRRLVPETYRRNQVISTAKGGRIAWTLNYNGLICLQKSRLMAVK